jgi:DNA-binding MarR family transcriptional regulator
VITRLVDAFNTLDSINKAMADWLENSITSCNLTLLELRILDSLAQGVATTAVQCSQQLNAMSSKVTLSIENLEKAGLVQRVRAKPDRRLVVLQLSDEGLEIYEHALRAIDDQWKKVMSNAGADVMQMAAVFAGQSLVPIPKLITSVLRERS